MADLADRYNAGMAGPQMDAPMRASDADRHAAGLVLQDAVARGLLTPDEGSERMATAYAAVHVADLHPLTADLRQTPTKSNEPPGWRVLATMAVDQLRFSFSDNHSGHLNRGRVAVALLLAFVLMLAVGFLTTGLFDGGPTPSPGGFNHH
jgi:hypothetical protein